MNLTSKLIQVPTAQDNAVILAPVCILGCLSGYLYQKWRNDERKEQLTDMLLNADCGIATDHIEDGLAQLDSAELTFGDVEPTQTAVMTKRGVATLNKDSVEIKQHRRIRAGRSMKYMNCVIAECKAKFGVPTRDSSNIKAVNRYAVSIMQSHGLRPSHIRDCVSMIVNMVFLPTKAELEGLALLNSASSNILKIQYCLEMSAAGILRAN